MKNIFYSVGLLSIILGFSLTSCTTDTVNKLQGEWRLVPIHDVADTLNETWEFTNDSRLIVRQNGAQGVAIISEGKYSVEAKFPETRLTTSEMTNNYNFYEAEWWIVELKAGKLYIVNDKDGGLYNREFER